MNTGTQDRRLAENEVVFRSRNEEIQQGFEHLKEIANEDNQANTLSQIEVSLHYYCECSDENCRERISILPSRYDAVHVQLNRFTVVPGHQVISIEKVVQKRVNHYVVEKFVTPRPDVTTLQPTDVDNSSH